MSIGIFKETNEASEVRENIDNTEKPRNQILETPESYDDDFDSKLDNWEREDEAKKGENVESNESVVEKMSFLEKMRSLFVKKESSEGDDDKNIEAGNSSSERAKFLDYLRKDAPSLEEQAENAKELSEKLDQKKENQDEGRTPGDDAWERRFGRIEEEEKT